MVDLSADEHEFLASMFDLARARDLGLVGYVDQGVPVNLTTWSATPL